MNRPNASIKHPEADWEFQCSCCGDQIDVDHNYCKACDQMGGEWVLIGEDNEPVNYRADKFKSADGEGQAV